MASQGNLFDNNLQKNFILTKKFPYKFSYKFIDDTDKERTLMIEDWEIGQLYWNCGKQRLRQKHNAETPNSPV